MNKTELNKINNINSNTNELYSIKDGIVDLCSVTHDFISEMYEAMFDEDNDEVTKICNRVNSRIDGIIKLAKEFKKVTSDIRQSNR